MQALLRSALSITYLDMTYLKERSWEKKKFVLSVLEV